MNRKVFIFMLSWIGCLGISGQSWEWAKKFEPLGDVNIESFSAYTVIGSDDNVYTVGVFKDIDAVIGTETLTNQGKYDIFLCSYDNTGNFRWATSIGSTQNDDIAGIVLDNSNNLYIGGAFKAGPLSFGTDYDLDKGDGEKKYDSFVAKYNSSGTFQWAQRVFWGSHNERMKGIALDKDNSLIVTTGVFRDELIYSDGTDTLTINSVSGENALFVATHNLNATAVDTVNTFRTNSTSISFNQVNNYLIGTTVSGYFVSGDLDGSIFLDTLGVHLTPSKDTLTSAGSTDALLFLVDNNLDPVWARKGGSTGFDHVNSAISDDDGHVYIAGKFEGASTTFDATDSTQSSTLTNNGAQEMYLAKYNRQGDLQWIKTLGDVGNDDAFGLALNDSLIQFAGNLEESGIINTGFAVYDHDGAFIAQETMDGDSTDRGKAVAFDQAGANYVMGYYRSDTLFADTIALSNEYDTINGFLVKYSYPLSLKITDTQHVSCKDSADGSITVQGVFGTQPYTYEWDPSVSSTNTASGLAPGDYIITVTDAALHEASDTVTISEPDYLSIARTITDVSCHTSNNGTKNDGSVDITVSGGTAPYTYDWSSTGSGSPSDEDQYDLIKADYTVTVSDANLCQLDSTFSVGEPDELGATVDSSQDVTSQGSGDGAIYVTPQGGTGSYYYAWTGPSGYSASTEDIENLDGGQYKLGLSDDNSCSDTTQKTINEPGVLVVADSSVHIDCYDSLEGEIYVMPSGGLPPYNYSWSHDGGKTDSVATGLPAGYYKIIVTDQGTAKDSVEITLIQPDSMTIVLTATDLECYGACDGSIAMSRSGGTSPYTYSWTGPGGFTSTNQNISNLCDSIYDVVVTDANGCHQSARDTVDSPSEISISYVKFDASCNTLCDGEIDLTVAGGTAPYSYLWSNNLTSQDIDLLCADTYDVTVTDANNCVKDSTGIEIVEPAAISVSFGSITHNICHENNGNCTGEATANPSGGSGSFVSYQWRDPAAQTGAAANNLCAGDIWCVVTDSDGCIDSNYVTINQPQEIIITMNSQDINCNGADDGIISSSVAPPGSYTFQWEDDLGETGATRTGLSAGVYKLTVTNTNFCTATDSAEVSEPDALTITGESTTNLTCTGSDDGTLTINTSGGTAPVEYTISPGDSSNNTGVFVNLPAGDYSVSVDDSEGCGPVTSSVLTVSVDPYDLVIDNVAVDSVNCYGGNDGSIDITISGGATPYGFSWSNMETTEDITDLPAATYVVTVTDNIGCSVDSTINVYEPDTLVITGDVVTDPSCAGVTDGSITTSVSGGTVPYGFNWTGPGGYSSTDQDITGLEEGNYKVIVTDMNSCQDSAFMTLTEPEVLNAAVQYDSVSCHGSADGTITISSASGGTGYFEYSTDNGTSWQSDSNFASLDTGSYAVIIRDSINTGCQVILRTGLVISQPDSLEAVVAATDVSCFGGSDGSISVTSPAGGSGYYEYSNDGGSSWQSSGDFASLSAASYDVRMRDSLVPGCSVALDAALAVGQPAVLAAAVDSTNVTCNGGANGRITLSNSSGGSGYYEYSGDGGTSWQTDTVFTGLSAGNYNVQMRDSLTSSCVVTLNSSLEITQPDVLDATVAKADISCYGSADGTITVSLSSGGSGAYEFSNDAGASWQSDTTFISLSAASYDVRMRDEADSSCTVTLDAALEITEPDSLYSETVFSDITCKAADDGWIKFTNTSGGSGSYEFSIDDGSTWNTADSLGGLAQGDYGVWMRDAGATSCEKDLGTITITEPDSLDATLSSTDISCAGADDGSITISNISGGSGSYEFNIGGDWVTDSSFNGLAADVYTVRMRDSINTACDRLLDFAREITQPDSIEISLATTDNTCNGASEGAIDATVLEGTTPYAFAWTGPGGFTSTEEDITGLAAGDYKLVVTDANLCADSAGTTLTDPDVLLADTAHTDISCNGAADGTITFSNPRGGSGTYEYSIGAGWQSSGSFTALAADDYTVSIRDASATGCVLELGTITIDEGAALAGDLDSSMVSCFGGNDGSITIMGATGGSGILEYTIDGGFTWQRDTVFSDLQAGTFDVRMHDSLNNGCEVVLRSALTITEPDQLSASLASTDPTCSGANDGTITVSGPAGGSGAYQYSYDGGSTWTSSADATGLAGGSYNVQIRDMDAASCVAVLNANLTLQSPDSLTADIDSSNISCTGSADGAISISNAAGGSGNHEFSFDGGVTWTASADTTGLSEGQYTVQMRDAGSTGCTVTLATITITDPDPISISIVDTSSISCAGSGDGEIEVSASGGTGDYTYTLSPGSSQDNGLFDMLSAGKYVASVSDANDCEPALTDTLQIFEPAALSIDTLVVTNELNEEGDGKIYFVIIGGTLPLDVSLEDSVNSIVSPATDSTFENLSAGDYTLMVIDANSCSVDTSLTVGLVTVDDMIVKVYDVITPSLVDGRNDFWEIEVYRDEEALKGGVAEELNIHYPDCKVLVYSSSGELVFSSNGYEEEWDGKKNNKVVPAGTYYYVIDLGNGTDPLSGTLTIVK